MCLNVPLIVIPNPVLQDNHQLELAEELQKQRYALHGDLTYVQSSRLPMNSSPSNDNRNLAQSLRIHESQKSSHPTNTPPNPLPAAQVQTRDYAPTIWDIAAHITEAERQPSAAAARMVSVLDEREREAFERLVEG